MTVKEPHTLGAEEARVRIQKLLSNLKVKFADQITDMQENWSGNQADFSFKMMGFTVKGTLSVSDSDATLEGKLPFMAKPFQRTIEQTIRENARELLDAPSV